MAGVHGPAGRAGLSVVGRPSKATAARLEAVCAALRAGATREEAAAHAGVDRTTLWRWADRQPGVRREMERAEADFAVQMSALVTREAADDWRAAAWQLDRARARRDRRESAAASAAGRGAAHRLDAVPVAEQAALARAWAERLEAEAVAAP
jgi:hypothetical protein